MLTEFLAPTIDSTDPRSLADLLYETSTQHQQLCPRQVLGVRIGLLGARTLRVIDHGKVAAVFIEVATERAVRIVPQRQARERALDYAPGSPSRWQAQRDGYQIMPNTELFTLRPVQLTFSLQ